MCALLCCAALPLRAEVSRALLDVQERLFLEGSGRDIFPGASIYEPDFVNAFYERAGYRRKSTLFYSPKNSRYLRLNRWMLLEIERILLPGLHKQRK